MAHPEVEAPEMSTPQSVEQKAAGFEQFLYDDEEPETPETEAEDSDELESDELDADDVDEDQEDESDEQEVPAIDAPVSLNAEEKEVFAQLPPEAQQAWAASETRRNSQVQEATTKASNAQREAQERAAQADVEAKQVYAQQLEQFVAAFEPQPPDPALAQSNPQAYIAQDAQYRAMKSEFDALVGQVRNTKEEASTEAMQAFIQQRDRELMNIPEVANPETRKEYLDRAFSVASELGYDPGELSQGMQARDILALAKVAELKDKAERYDRAMSKKMQKVRAAKGKGLRPKAAPQDSTRAAKSTKAWQRVKDAGGNKTAQFDAMAEWLEASGHL